MNVNCAPSNMFNYRYIYIPGSGGVSYILYNIWRIICIFFRAAQCGCHSTVAQWFSFMEVDTVTLHIRFANIIHAPVRGLHLHNIYNSQMPERGAFSGYNANWLGGAGFTTNLCDIRIIYGDDAGGAMIQSIPFWFGFVCLDDFFSLIRSSLIWSIK